MLGCTEVLGFAISLFSILNPPSIIGAIAAISGRFPRNIQRLMAIRVAKGYVLLLLGTAWVGIWILKAFGISTAALMVVGGVALLAAGLPLMMKGTTGEQGNAASEADGLTTTWQSLIAMPLTFPLTVGGGTVALVVAMASRYHSFVDLLVISAVIIVMGIIVGLTHYLAPILKARLSPETMGILTRAQASSSSQSPLSC